MAITNTARYCDGLSRQFTTVFTTIDGDILSYAASFGASVDPLDCCAMTPEEAHNRGMRYADVRLSFLPGSTIAPARFFEVVLLPDGWSND